MKMLLNIFRVIQWLPVIWRDVDWDYEGLLDIIDYKVHRMRQLHFTKSHGVHWSERVLEMDKLRHLIALHKEDPDDEWNAYYYSHNMEDINAPVSKERRKVLAYSHRRCENNWHNIWSYLDEELRKWWD